MGAADNLRIIDTAVITPDDPSLPARSLPFTFFDVEWLRPRPLPVQRVFFYRLTQDHQDTVHQLISDLKRSLSRALTLFYPLAGHVRRTPGARSSNRYELFYQPGDGVAFTAAEYDLHVDAFLASSSDRPAVPVSTFAPLVPLLPKGRAVLAVQATVLRGGLALGVTVHHSACDGASSTHFLHTWAAACAGATDMPPPPVIDRTLIADPNNLYDVYCTGMSLPSDGGEIEFTGTAASPYPDDRVLATFALPRELIQSIKDAIAAEAARRNVPTPLRCSSVLAAYSFIWLCYCRAKQRQNSVDVADDQARATAYFLFAVDHRKRLNPPVPDRYMGNCLSPAIAAAPHDALAGTGGTAGGLLAAFQAITDALEEAVGERTQERWEGCMEKVREAAKVGIVSVAGSSRFQVYDLDFGFGRPAKVYMVSAARTGSIAVSDAHDGRGGIELGVPLPMDGMERFRRCFADAASDIGYKV